MISTLVFVQRGSEEFAGINRGKEYYRKIYITGAKCSCSCFGSAMETKANSAVLCEAEPFWPRFKGCMKRKNSKQSQKTSPSSKYTVEISPARLINGESAALVRIGSISRDGEFIPVILSPVHKAISNEQRQITKKKKKKKPVGLDAAEVKVKPRDAKIALKSHESEACTQELAPKKISEGEVEVAVRKFNRSSWVRVAKAFRFTKAPDLHPTNLKRPKLSEDSHQVGQANDSETAVIEQPKGQEIRQEEEVADSIAGPIDEPAEPSQISAKVDSRSCKMFKKSSSLASAPNTPLKRRGIKSVPVSSSSYPELPRPDMSNTTPNSQPKKLHMSAERKGTITGNATGEGEGYNMAINFSVLIIIMGCLVVFSDRLLAVVCTSIWWYLSPSLLKRNRASTAAAGGVNNDISDLKHPRQRKFNRNLSDVSAAIHKGRYRKKEGNDAEMRE